MDAPRPEPPPRVRPSLRLLLAVSLTIAGVIGLTAAFTCAEASVSRRAQATPFARPNAVLQVGGRDALGFVAWPRFTSSEGVFTLECRVRGSAPEVLETVIGCRHKSGFGITWCHPDMALDRPTGWVNVQRVNGTHSPGYLLLKPLRRWEWERFTHLALTFDGSIARMYVDGEPVAEAGGAGAFRSSSHPLYVGADTDERGRAAQFFAGEIDDVRISSVVRYTEAFTPPRRHRDDAHTTLLLDFEDQENPLADLSRFRRRPQVVGAPRRVIVR